MKDLEKLLQNNDLKEFHKRINSICHIRASAPIVKGLELESGETLKNRAEII